MERKLLKLSVEHHIYSIYVMISHRPDVESITELHHSHEAVVFEPNDPVGLIYSELLLNPC